MSAEPIDWDSLVWRLHDVIAGRTCLADADGHVYLLNPCYDRRKRLTIEVYRDGRFDPAWTTCEKARADIPAEARALFQVRKRWAWPKARRKPKAHQARLRSAGMDPDAHFYQIATWHDPAKCLAHLRRHLPGLHPISGAEHDAAVRARQEAA